MSRSALVAIAVLAAGTLPRPAEAQSARAAQETAPAAAAPARPSPSDLKGQVAAMQKELDQLRAAAAQAQTVAGSVELLGVRVAALEQEIGRLGRQRAAGPDLVRSIDQLSGQAAALRRDVEALRTQVSGIEVPAGGAVGGAAHQRGFAWTTADGAYSLSIGGYVQPRYEASLAEAADSVNRSTFRLRRGRLVVGGHVAGEELTYKLQVDVTTPEPVALDYYADYEFSPELAVRAGQDRLYFTRVGWTGDSTIDLLERPAAAEGLRYDRDIGLWAHGELLGGQLAYHAGVSNGAGANRRNDNIDMLALARMDAVLVGARFDAFSRNLTRDPALRLMVGAGIVHDLVQLPPAVAGTAVNNRDVNADGDIDNVRVWSSSADVAMRWNGLEVIAEGIWRHERWGTILQHSANQAVATLIDADVDGHRNYLGGYVHVSYPLVPERLLAAARVGHSRVALLGVGGRTVDAPPAGDRLVEVNGQLRYFANASVSLGGSYTLFNYNMKSGPEEDEDIEHVLIAQGQVSF